MKKIKKSKVIISLISFVLSFLIIIGLIFFTIHFIDHNQNSQNKIQEKRKTNEIKQIKNDLKNVFLEKNIDGKYSFVFCKDNNRYKAYYFDYISGKKIELDHLIKDGFWDKVDYLLDLKYPKFITSVLNNHDKTDVVIFDEDEIIVYFYDYEIVPKIEDELYLKVNYNEVKDFLNFTIPKTNNYQNEYYSDYDEKNNYVAITFDDGPGNYTNNLIDILNNNKAKATFFILGNKIENNRNILKYMNDSAHEIGYHSYSHKNFKNQSLDKIKEEFELSNELLKESLGKEFILVRPPYGEYNNVIKNCLAKPLVLWSVDTNDWRYRNSEYLYNYLLDNIKPGDIVLFHDIHKTSVEAIEKLLPILYSKNYRFVTVSELAKIYNVSLEDDKVYRNFSK